MGREWYYWGGGHGRSSRPKRHANNKTTAFGNGGGGDCSGGSSSYCRSKKKEYARTTLSGSINNEEKRSVKNVMKETNSTVSGCMGAMFHFFDSHHHFHHFPLTTHHHHDSSSSPPPPPHDIPPPKGVEAPRNSLESTDQEVSLSSSPTVKPENLNIPMGIQIKTKPTRTKPEALINATTTESYSPSTKSPNLVARLMGLDLVPDKSLRSSSSSSSLLSSPCSSSAALSVNLTPNLRSNPHTSLKHQYTLRRNSVDGSFAGTRSLPETPRISLGRRSDVDYYQQHRLSLHINRENVSEQEPGAARFGSSRLKEMKTNDEDNNKENRSPREYARQIVMQLKENIVNRRSVGTDITNITRNKEQTTEYRRSQDFKKTSNILTTDHLSTPYSSSPKFKFLENPKTKSTSPKPQPTDPDTKVVKIIQDNKCRLLRTVPEEPTAQNHHDKQERKQTKLVKKKNTYKRVPEENEMKFCSRMVKPPQTMQEEPFVRIPAAGNRSPAGSLLHQGDKKCKKTPLSNGLLNLSTTVPSLHPVKRKDSSTKKPSNLYVDALKVTEAQSPRRSDSLLHGCPSQTPRYNIVRREITSTGTSAAAAELDYITRILRRTGVDRDTLISHAKWFSPSHPLDPSIFYFLEHFAVTSGRSTQISPENLSLRCNRKLLFHLIDEILVEVLKPYMNMKPWVSHYPRHRRRQYIGSELIDKLCERIGRFPRADCRVLEDIDALVAGDLPESMEVRGDLTAFEEQGEGIVTELERDILETLVTETASEYLKTVSFWGKVSVPRGTST